MPFITSVDVLQVNLARPSYFAPECFPSTDRSPVGAVVVPRASLPRAQHMVDFLRTRFRPEEDGAFLVFRVR